MKKQKRILNKTAREIVEGKQKTLNPMIIIKKRRRYNYFERRWEEV